jgi:hypothetical protein
MSKATNPLAVWQFLKKAASLTRTCARENARYALSRLNILKDGDAVIVESTDGRIAARLRFRGSSAEGIKIVGKAAMVEARTIRSLCRMAQERDHKDLRLKIEQTEKNAGKGVSGYDMVTSVAIVTLDREGDRWSPSARTEDEAEGHFPALNDVWPKKEPEVAFTIDPMRLALLLSLAAEALGGVCEPLGVTIRFYGANKPIRVTSDKNQEVTFDAMLMPVSGVVV